MSHPAQPSQLVLAFDAASASPSSDELCGLSGAPGGSISPAGTRHPEYTDGPIIVFVRHPRARQYLIRLVDERTVRVTLPRWGSRKEAAAFAKREQPWIEKQRRQLKRLIDEQARLAAQSVVVDASVPTAESSGLWPFDRKLIEQAHADLPLRVNQLALRHGLTVSRVSIRNQRWRWGSCSRSGHICLNWRLIAMPHWVRDYVIIHELMHLRRMDHSKRFWKLVARACPEYQLARRYLREHAMTWC